MQPLTLYVVQSLTAPGIGWDKPQQPNIYLLPYLLTAHSTVRLDKLTGLKPVKKFPAFYWTRRFITAFTSARHLSVSWDSPTQSIPPHPTSWRSILIYLPICAWVSPVVTFPQVSPPNPVHTSLLPQPSYMPCPSHSSRNNTIIIIIIIINYRSYLKSHDTPVFCRVRFNIIASSNFWSTKQSCS
jgi:hypothetical protein